MKAAKELLEDSERKAIVRTAVRAYLNESDDESEEHEGALESLPQVWPPLEPHLIRLIEKLGEEHEAPPNLIGCAVLCFEHAVQMYVEASATERQSWAGFESSVVEPVPNLQLHLNADQHDHSNEHATMSIVRLSHAHYVSS